MTPKLVEMVVAYSNAVGKFGPGSDQARQVRLRYAGQPEFSEYADALDRIKQTLGGSGMHGEESRTDEEEGLAIVSEIATLNAENKRLKEVLFQLVAACRWTIGNFHRGNDEGVLEGFERMTSAIAKAQGGAP
jgi:hypothetical protein